MICQLALQACITHLGCQHEYLAQALLHLLHLHCMIQYKLMYNTATACVYVQGLHMHTDSCATMELRVP